MKNLDLTAALPRQLSRPWHRAGRCPTGRKAVIAYFIMGRSENSRNRVFEETQTVSAPGL